MQTTIDYASVAAILRNSDTIASWLANETTENNLKQYLDTVRPVLMQKGLVPRYINILKMLTILTKEKVYDNKQFWLIIMDTSIASKSDVLSAWREFESEYYEYFIAYADYLE